MTQVNCYEKLRRYTEKSFISFFRQGLAKDAKRNKEWFVYIYSPDPDDDHIYWQANSYFENNYPCGILIDFEGSKNRKYYLKELRFAILKAVDGVNRQAYYHYSDWSEMY
jgi:hypothetical protein